MGCLGLTVACGGCMLGLGCWGHAADEPEPEGVEPQASGVASSFCHESLLTLVQTAQYHKHGWLLYAPGLRALCKRSVHTLSGTLWRT